ncbi:MAG: hypothetical protein AVDCRST_MAG90-3295, partial [uncultured Microvirga sp.]
CLAYRSSPSSPLPCFFRGRPSRKTSSNPLCSPRRSRPVSFPRSPSACPSRPLRSTSKRRGGAQGSPAARSSRWCRARATSATSLPTPMR